MTREQVFDADPAHLADELDVDPRGDRRGHALQGGPRGRLAGPVHARAGARGHLRREHVRRAGGADPDRRSGRRLRRSPTRAGPSMRGDDAARPSCSTSCPRSSPDRSSRTPPGASAASDSYTRLAFLGDSVLALAVTAHLYPRLEAEQLRRGQADEDPRAGRLRGRPAGRSPSGSSCRSACAPRRPPGVRQSAAALVETERVLASVIEAVIGACYLHAGYERTAEAVVEAFAPEIEGALEHPVDFKSALQELLARRGAEVSYEITARGRAAARAHVRGRRARRWPRARQRQRPQQEARRAGGRARGGRASGERAMSARAAEVAHAERLQVVPRAHAPGLRPGRQRRRRAERLGQVERHRRGAVGDGRAVAAGGARPVDAGRDLRRRARRAAAQRGRGRDRARQLRRDASICR